jgi:hypothetical protein
MSEDPEIVQPGVPDTLIDIVREKALPGLLETFGQEVVAIGRACNLRPENSPREVHSYQGGACQPLRKAK